MAIKFIYNPNYNNELMNYLLHCGIFSVVCFLIYVIFVERKGILHYIAISACGLSILPWLLISGNRSHCDLVHEVIYVNKDDVDKVVVREIKCVGDNFDIKFTVNDDGSLSEPDDKNYIEVKE